jgi:hypothetical protein
MRIFQIANWIKKLAILTLFCSCNKHSEEQKSDAVPLVVVVIDGSAEQKRSSFHFDKPSYFRSLHTALVGIVENKGQSADIVIGDALRARHPGEINSSDDERLISLIRFFLSNKKEFGDALQSFGWMRIVDPNISGAHLRKSKIIIEDKVQIFSYFECGCGSDQTYYLSPQAVDLHGASSGIGDHRILVCVRTD